MALFLLQVTFPSVSTVHCPCPVPQQTGHGEQDTCSARPPAFLSPAQASADLNQRMELAQNQPTPLLQNCSAPQSSQPVQKWRRARPAQGKPESILFRQTDLPSIMKPPQSHTRNGQQYWHRQEDQSPWWEPAQRRWCPQPSKPRWSHAVSPRRSQMHRFSQRQHKADRVNSGSHPFHPLLCQAWGRTGKTTLGSLCSKLYFDSASHSGKQLNHFSWSTPKNKKKKKQTLFQLAPKSRKLSILCWAHSGTTQNRGI